MSEHFCGWWDDVGGVKGLMTCGAIKDKRICVDIGDVGLERDTSELSRGASPPFEDRRFRHLNFSVRPSKMLTSLPS